MCIEHYILYVLSLAWIIRSDSVWCLFWTDTHARQVPVLAVFCCQNCSVLVFCAASSGSTDSARTAAIAAVLATRTGQLGAMFWLLHTSELAAVSGSQNWFFFPELDCFLALVLDSFFIT